MQRKPRNKVRKRSITNSLYKSRSHYKKQRNKNTPYKIPTLKSNHSEYFLEHDIETDRSSVVSDTGSDGHKSDSPAMSDRSVVHESMHVESPQREQPSGESSPTNLLLTSTSSPASNSISETLHSLTSNSSKSNDQSLVRACASGESNEVNGSSLLDGGQGSGASVERSVPVTAIISVQRGCTEAPLGALVLCLVNKIELLDQCEKRSQIELG